MKDGVCPKCEAKQIHRIESVSNEMSIRLSWMSNADLNYYVCVNCGYVEIFISRMQDLPKIAEKYPRV